MFTDSHCHLNAAELRNKLPQIRQAMQDAKVDRALCICTTLEEFDDVHALATTYDNFWSSVGATVVLINAHGLSGSNTTLVLEKTCPN